MSLGIDNHLKSSGMRDPLVCGHALVTQTLSRELSCQNNIFPYGEADGARQPRWHPIQEYENCDFHPLSSGSYILWELASGCFPDRNTRFPQHFKLRMGSRSVKPCSKFLYMLKTKSDIGGVSSHLRWNAGSISGLVSSGVQEAGPSHCSKSCKPPAMIKIKTKPRVATWNVGNPTTKISRSIADSVVAKSRCLRCVGSHISVTLHPTRTASERARPASSHSSFMRQSRVLGSWHTVVRELGR